jgi:hypothetical protein
MSDPIINSRWEFIHLRETMKGWRVVPPDEDESKIPYDHESPEEEQFPSIAHALNHFGRKGYGLIGSPHQEMLGGGAMILSRCLVRKDVRHSWMVAG